MGADRKEGEEGSFKLCGYVEVSFGDVLVVPRHLRLRLPTASRQVSTAPFRYIAVDIHPLISL